MDAACAVEEAGVGVVSPCSAGEWTTDGDGDGDVPSVTAAASTVNGLPLARDTASGTPSTPPTAPKPPTDDAMRIARRLEANPRSYVPGTRMFTQACSAWQAIFVCPKMTSTPPGAGVDPSCRTWWFVARNDIREGYVERDLPLASLQKLVKCLDDQDMCAFFTSIVLDSVSNFEDLFTPEFVGDDEWLACIRDVIGQVGREDAASATPPAHFYHSFSRQRTATLAHSGDEATFMIITQGVVGTVAAYPSMVSRVCTRM